VKNIKDLKALMFLNLSQNVNLTDKTLELISGTAMVHQNKLILCPANLSNVSQIRASILHRLDCFGLSERLELAGIKCRPQTPEGPAEPAVVVP
jgi:hypothetical protein